MRKTWFKKGFTPINKDTKEENRELDNQNEFRYIRPTTSEVEIAKQDPLRPSCASQWEDSNRKPDSTMVLRPKSDGLLEVEKKNSGVGERLVKLIFYLFLIAARANKPASEVRKDFLRYCLKRNMQKCHRFVKKSSNFCRTQL